MRSTNGRNSNGLQGKAMLWLKISSLMVVAGTIPLTADTIKINAGGNTIEVTIGEPNKLPADFSTRSLSKTIQTPTSGAQM